MSVIVAIKDGDAVYMGADSQRTTQSSRVDRGFNESYFKINRLGSGMLVGFCGSVKCKQIVLSVPNIFTLDKDGQLTKKHIVREIVPRLVELFDQISDNRGEADLYIMLAHKDRLYTISADFSVRCRTYGASIGAGREFAKYGLYEMTELPVRERILNALKESARRTESVSGPYVLIDTRNYQYEVVDLGGENH